MEVLTTLYVSNTGERVLERRSVGENSESSRAVKLLPAPAGQLTAVCDPSAELSLSKSSWPPWALHTRGTQPHRQANTNIQNKQNKKFKTRIHC